MTKIDRLSHSTTILAFIRRNIVTFHICSSRKNSLICSLQRKCRFASVLKTNGGCMLVKSIAL